MMKIQKVVNNLYYFYRVFIASNFRENLPAPHIQKLSKELRKIQRGDYQRLCVAMPPRHKIANSTPVLTTEGWKTHGELKINDYVFGLDGKPTKVIGTSEESPCNKLLTFSNGSKILAHEDHLWTVHKRGNKKPKTVPTREIEKDYVEYGDKKRYRYQLPLIEPLEFSEKELSIDPYFLGYWLGDGTANKPCITHPEHDNQFINKIPYKITSQSIHKDTGVYTTYFGNQNITKWFKELNLYDNKHIPEIYKKGSIKQRLELLAGLIDSDGSVDENGRVRFVNTNKKLIDDYFELCNSLGLYPYYHSSISAEKNNSYKKNDKWNIKSTKTSYTIGFQPRFNVPTIVPRKKVIEKGIRRRLSITNVDTVKSENGKCIEVEKSDGVYLVGKNLIPTHNSKSSLITLAYPLWLIFQDPSLNILIVNNTSTLSEKFGISIREYIRKYGEYFNVYLSDIKHSNTHLMFCNHKGELYNGSIRLTGANGSITGQDADYIILDDIYKGIEDITPTLLEKKIDWFNTIIEQRIEPHTRLIILHTRWSTDDLQGHLHENDKDSYKFITFPAILPSGEPLWKERYTLEILESKRTKIGERLFSSLYQQKPLDTTSDFFQTQYLQWDIKPKNNIIATARAWDIAGSEEVGDSRDYTAGVYGTYYAEGRLLISDIVFGQFGNNNLETIKKTVKNDGIGTVQIIETGVAAAGKLLYNEWSKQLKGYFIEQAPTIGSKIDRATPFCNAIADGKIHVSIQNDEIRQILMDQLKSFPYGKHDDIIDAIAHLYNYFNTNYGEEETGLVLLEL